MVLKLMHVYNIYNFTKLIIIIDDCLVGLEVRVSVY